MPDDGGARSTTTIRPSVHSDAGARRQLLQEPSSSGDSAPGFKAYAAFVAVACAAALLVGLIVLLLVLLIRARRRRRAGDRSPAAVIPAASKEMEGIGCRQGGMKLDVESGGGSSSTSSSSRGKEKKGMEEDVSGRAAERMMHTVSTIEEVEAPGHGMGNIGWGRWYSAAELEAATGRFKTSSVIGEGGYGTVYRGVLPDSSVVAVKNLLNNRGQAEKEFKVEVEAIGKVRHKNLVGLLGYCAEGPRRMLVFEYMDNGNLEQWLHGPVGPVSPLSWDIRMKIAVDTAKGIAYLHEGLEPKVVHRDIKSSNILLDQQWNARVSDFGLAKLLGSGSSYVTTRVMGTFGYVAPEYASTGMLNEASDVYSFGVLLIELVTGRSPVGYSRVPGEVSLVDWFKGMVGSRRGEDVLDPLMGARRPPDRALKRLLLICLRCVDSDARARPKMGQVVHMLEGEDFPFRARIARPAAYRASSTPTGKVEDRREER